MEFLIDLGLTILVTFVIVFLVGFLLNAYWWLFLLGWNL